MSYIDPTPSSFPGRHGPSVAILTIISDPNGVGVAYSPVKPRATTSLRDFPTFGLENISVFAGKWYYEVDFETDGCIQVGAVIPGKFKELSGRGNGVGDGVASWAYDGSKACVYASKASIKDNIPKATKGDRIGIGLDMNSGSIVFFKNGEQFAKVALAENNSGFEAGKDALQPAASLSGRMTISWFFERDECKFMPADYMPLQMNPTFPASLGGSTKMPADEGDAAAKDPLSINNSVGDLHQAYATLLPLLDNPAAAAAAAEDKELAKRVLAFANSRGAYFEYGCEHKLSSFATAGKKLTSVVQGQLPKLEVQRGSKNAEDYMKDAQADMNDRRAMVWMCCALAHVYPKSKTAAELVGKIKAAIEDFDKSAVEAFLKLRYIAALEDRKKNKVLEYGLFWHLERFENELNKDRSKMSAAQQQDFAKEVGKTADKFVAWRAWFVGAVGDIPFHTAALEAVDAPLAKFNSLFDPAAMAKEAAGKAREAALKDLVSEIERGRRRIQEAKNEFERFPERAEEGIRKLNEQIASWEKTYRESVAAAPDGKASNLTSEVITKMGPAACCTTDEFGSWKAELAVATEKWRRDETFRLLKREAQDLLRQCRSKLDEAWNLVDHYRPLDAQTKLFEAVEQVAELKARPGFLGLDFLDEFFFGASGYEASKSKTEKKIYDVIKNRACHDHARELDSHMTQMKNLFDHYRNNDALEAYHKAQEKLEEIKTLTDDYQSEEKLAATVKEYNEYVPKFLQSYKERVVFVQARDKVDSLTRKLSGVEDMVNHYRETDALAEAAAVEEGLDELKNDVLLGSAPQVIEFAELCRDKLPELRGKANLQIVNREVAEVLRVLESTFTDVQSHFDHYRFEHCLTALAKYKELGGDLEREKRYRGRADVEDALSKLDTRLPEFEKVYREKMAKRALEEEIRLARSDFTSVESMFDHSRFDECLQELQKAREKVDSLAKNEQYSDGGELAQVRDSFVKVSREQTIAQFLQKYNEKVVVNKAQEVARDIRSSINSAKNQLDHCQFEAFLASINKARDQIAAARPSDDANLPLDAEPWLVYNHHFTQEAINDASKEIFTLSQKYEEDQCERKTSELIRNVKGPLGQAATLLDHCNFEGCLTELAKAQDALSELSLVTSAKAAATVAEATKEIQNFQQQYTAVMGKRRDDDLARAVRSQIQTAKDHFSHFRNEDSLKAIAKAREDIDNVTQQGSAELRAKEIAGWTQQLAELEKEYAERVLAREANDAIAAVRAEMKFAADHHDHHRDENALISLNSARERAANLVVNVQISQLPQVVAYLQEFNAQRPEWDQKLAQRALEKETAELIRQLKSGLSELKNSFEHHLNEKAAAVYNTIHDDLILFVRNPRYAGQPGVEAVGGEAEAQMTAFLEDYRNRVISTKFQEHQRNANHKFTEAVDKLGRSMFAESVESYYEARDLLGKIGGDPLMFGYQPADAFINEFAPKIEDFKKQIASKQRDRALENAKREIKSSMDLARTDFDHHRDEASLNQLNKAREFLESFVREFGSSDVFVQEQRKEQAEFEKAYAERVFNAELARRERKVSERRAAAKDAFAHSRFEEAVRSLAEADEAAQDIATDDRFLHLDRVSVFLKSHNEAAASARAELQSTLKARASQEALRNIKHNVSDAKNCYDHFRFDQSLQSAQKAIELIDDAESSGDVSATDLGPLRSEIAAFKTKFQQERLAAEADAQVRAIHATLNSARFLLSHNRNEECMKTLQQARDEATKVGDSKFAGLPSITKFFDEWPALFRAIETELSEKLFAIRVRDATSDVKSAIREAETCVSHHLHDRAMTAIQKARDLLADLQDESNDLSSIAAVVAFVKENVAVVQALAQRVADELFSREVDEVIRNAKANVDRAEQMFSRFAYEVALQSFNAAKEVVDVATNPAESRISASKTLIAYVEGAFKPFVASFSKKYADAVLADEARKAASDVKAALSRCVLYLDRNVREKCIEELVAAQEAATAAFASDDSMLRTLSVAAEILAEVKKVHESVAKTFLQKDADEVIRAAKKIAGRVHENQKRLLDCDSDLEALREAVASLLGTDAKKEPVAKIYSALPEVASFIVGEIQPIFKAGKKALYEGAESGAGSSSSSSSGSSKGHNFEKDPACLGNTINSRWPQIVELRKGLPNKAIGPDVHPRYFSGLKILNQQAKNAATNIKELEKELMNPECYDFSGNPNTRCYPFVGSISEAMDRVLPDYIKGIRQIEGEIGDAEKCKADELLQQILAGFDKWATAWTETKKHFQNVEKIVLRYRAMRKGQDVLRECFQECREVSGFSTGTVLQRSKFEDFFTIDSLYSGRFALFPFSWSSLWSGRGSPSQTEMFSVTSNIAKTLTETMNTWGKDTKDGKFPNSEEFDKCFKQVMADCKKEHAVLGFRRLCQAGVFSDEKVSQDKAKKWFDALSKYPIARRYAVKLGNEYAYDYQRFCGRPWSSRTPLVDPTPADVDGDEDEKESWYAPTWEWVLNLDPAERQKLAYDKKPDQSTAASSEVYTDFCKKSAGKIVFAASFIDEQGKLKEGSVADKFDLKTATEGAGIFGRAFWPRAIANYPVAKDIKSGKILYGPAGMSDDLMHCDVLLKGFIDGKQIDNEFKPEDAITDMVQRDKAKKSGDVDFYAYTQTCRLRILADDLNDPAQLRDTWHRMSARFAYEFSKLSPGDHKVELQLCFRLVSTYDNAFALHPELADKKRLFPFYTTPVSSPIASGSFTISVPKTPVPRRSILPKPVPLSATAPGKRAALEKQILDAMNKNSEWGGRANQKEAAFYVTLTGNSQVSQVETFIVGEDSRGRILLSEEPVRYGRDFRVMIRRKKSSGWPRESVAYFLLEAAGPRKRHPPTDIDVEGIAGFWVASGAHFEVDARFLSEEDEKLVA